MKSFYKKIFKKSIKIFPSIRYIDKIRGVEQALRYDYLYDVITKNKFKKIMEIGMFKGERAFQMIETSKKFNKSSQIEYYGFDLFEMMDNEIHAKEVSKKPFSLEKIKNRLETTGATVHLFKGFTENTIPEVIDSLSIMDLIFIDGGHSIETIQNDWNWSQKLMDKNTVVIFDDYWSGDWGKRKDAGCQSLIKNLDKSKFNIKILPIQDSFKKEWGTLKINFVQVMQKSTKD